MSDPAAERKAQISSKFNTLAPDYDSGPGCFSYFGRRLLEAADIRPGQSVLDVATGRGAVLFPAAEQVGPTGKVIGVDLADEMVRATAAELRRRGLAATVQVSDAEDLDFPDATFDRVLCGFGLMFFPDQLKALGEFRRVLKPDGRLGVSTWRKGQNHEIQAIFSEFGIEKPIRPGWISEPADLSRLLEAADFVDIDVRMETHSFLYSGADEYWRQARGTGTRFDIDALDRVQRVRVRSALADRLRRNRQPDGIYSAATALIAVAAR